MKKVLLILAIATTAFTNFSCKKESIDPVAGSAQGNVKGNEVILGRVDEPGGGACPSTTVDLIAGQYYNAGSVTVTNDANYIYVTYTTANGYELTQTHLYVGPCGSIPVNNPGNPIPGQFPYSGNHNYINTVTYTIPISAIPAGGCGCIAAHAVVVKRNASGQVIETQTGWGNGVRINLSGGNWGMKFEYCSCTP